MLLSNLKEHLTATCLKKTVAHKNISSTENRKKIVHEKKMWLHSRDELVLL